MGTQRCTTVSYGEGGSSTSLGPHNIPLHAQPGTHGHILDSQRWSFRCVLLYYGLSCFFRCWLFFVLAFFVVFVRLFPFVVSFFVFLFLFLSPVSPRLSLLTVRVLGREIQRLRTQGFFWYSSNGFDFASVIVLFKQVFFSFCAC